MQLSQSFGCTYTSKYHREKPTLRCHHDAIVKVPVAIFKRSRMESTAKKLFTKISRAKFNALNPVVQSLIKLILDK